MSRIQLKKEVIKLLQEYSLPEIVNILPRYSKQSLLNPLFSGLCHSDELVRWHAISCFGKIVPEIGKENFEHARIIMRRFLWSLNDESGGIGWGAPESMAEIMHNDELLRKEYLHMLISYMREDGEEVWQDGNYLELPMLQRGLLWGVGRICSKISGEMRSLGVAEDLTRYLDSSDEQVVGLALWALGFLGVNLEAKRIDTIDLNRSVLHVFSEYKMQSIPFSQLISNLG